MSNITLKRTDPVIPNEKEIQLAVESSRTLAQISANKMHTFEFQIDGKKTIHLPSSVFQNAS